MNGKKAQIAWFILIGFILVLGAFLYFYVRSAGVESEFIEPKIAEVPAEFVPVSSQVEDCITSIAKDGLQLIGEHGGYISPAQSGKTSSFDPTEGSAVRFSAGSDLEIPYWHYLKSSNSCTGACEFAYGMPKLRRNEGEPSIEGQLDSYVNSKLKSCLNGFNALKEFGYTVTELGNASTKTSVTAGDVAVYVQYPVKASKGESATIKEYFVRIPLNLAAIYEQATLLTALQANFHFLERNTMNLITAFSAIDKDRLPAMSGLEFNLGGGVRWRKSEARKLMTEILTTYIQLMQVYNSNNYRPISAPASGVGQSLYNDAMLIPSNSSYSHLAVEFDYLPSWPIYFDLNCKGESCEPESASENLLSMLGIQRYSFVYDVSFPALVTIRDEAALNRQGYEFRFFLESNVHNNEPMPAEFKPISPSQIIEGSMLCSPGNADSNVTITVNDDTSMPVSSANVQFQCGIEACSIGIAENGTLNAMLPSCIGGVLLASMDGYLSTSSLLNTQLGQSASAQLTMHKKREVNVSVMKKRMVKGPDRQWHFSDIAIEMLPEEDALISMSRSGLPEFEAAASYSPSENSTITLVPGMYTIEVFLRKTRDLIIPAQEICAEDNCAAIPEVRINDSYQSGGLNINYTFAGSELDSGKLTIYVLDIDAGSVPESIREISDLAELANLPRYSALYYNALRPEASR